VTSWLVLLLAAGLASQGAAFLMQADLLPPLGSNLWDTSFLLSDQSLAGRILHTLIGYTAQPAGIQLVFYVVTLLVIGGLMRLVGSADKTARTGGHGSSAVSPAE
jgi:high-affinity iron transporter